MEIRNTLPYISQLKVTKLTNQTLTPTENFTQDGQRWYQRGVDNPGIDVEVTTYLGNEKGPAKPYRFPSRSYYEAMVDMLESLPARSEQQEASLLALQAYLEDASVIWCETILEAAQLPSLEDLWADVFSDALDEFSTWAEPQVEAGGIPTVLKAMQWDARLPYESSKSVTLKVGQYLGTVDGIDLTVAPVEHTLVFEDTATRTNRVMQVEQLTSRRDVVAGEVEALQAGVAKTAKQKELDQLNAELARLEAIDRGLLTDLLGNAAVQASMPALLMGIIGTLKARYWPDLDMQVVQERLALTLQGIN